MRGYYDRAQGFRKTRCRTRQHRAASDTVGSCIFRYRLECFLMTSLLNPGGYFTVLFTILVHVALTAALSNKLGRTRAFGNSRVGSVGPGLSPASIPARLPGRKSAIPSPSKSTGEGIPAIGTLKCAKAVTARRSFPAHSRWKSARTAASATTRRQAMPVSGFEVDDIHVTLCGPNHPPGGKDLAVRHRKLVKIACIQAQITVRRF